MALPSANNSTFDICDARNNRFTNLTYYSHTFVCIRLLLSACTCLASIKLLYLQTKTRVWFEGERPLILGILVANILGPAAVCVVAVSRLVTTIFALKVYRTAYVSWLQVISDASMLSLVLYIGAISIKSYLSLRSFSSNDKKDGLGKVELTMLTIFIMLFAFVLSLFGLNTRSQAIVGEANLVTDAVFYCICLSVQLATALILYKTKQLSKRLQTDFAVNRDQQVLESRVSLYRAIERTRALIPLSAANVVLWIIVWSLNFTITRIIQNAKTNNCGLPPEYYIWSSIMDCAAAVYGLIYPSMLCRKEESFSKRIRKAICCKYDLNNDSGSKVALPNGNQVGTIEKGNGNHWSALDAQWARVEKSKSKMEQSIGNSNIATVSGSKNVGSVKEKNESIKQNTETRISNDR